MELEQYLATGQIETVLAGGENYLGSRPLHYEWVKKVRDACERRQVRFIFGQTGNAFVKAGREYKIRSRTGQMAEALKSGLHYPPKSPGEVEGEIAALYAQREALAAARAKKRG